MIAFGTYFYLNGTLVRAKADIAVNATFTSGTNYETVTAGGLNDLMSAFPQFVGKTVEKVYAISVSGTVYEYTIPDNGYYFVSSFNRGDSSGSECAAFIGTDSLLSTYIQAAYGPAGAYARTTTSLVPFKKGTVIYVRAFFGNTESYAGVYRLT